MAQNKMLIDAAHSEETRVVVVRGNRVDEFDFESENKTQIRGNIYLAKVTRVEPSLQAAFVDYGGNRHGFLAFSEIHPDYYQIPIADRQALLEEDEAEEAEDKAREEEVKPARKRRRSRRKPAAGASSPEPENGKTAKSGDADISGDDAAEIDAKDDVSSNQDTVSDDEHADAAKSGDAAAADTTEEQSGQDTPADDPQGDDDKPTSISAANESDVISEPVEEESDNDDDTGKFDDEDDNDDGDDNGENNNSDDEAIESVGVEDALEEVPVRRKKRRQYKIQEVIKRRQIILVQIVKEERGNKGAALTTYLSLAGRYSVLMPNTARGGGISRKITNLVDRKRLKTIAGDLDVAEGMGVILRTAGASRTKAEIRRDFEYLLRLWENVRNLTLKSTAPCLVYEEGSLIKRSIRDLYDKDTGEIYVSGEEAYNEAKNFMRMLMPSHAKYVKQYTDKVPIFARNGVEAQLDKMLQPQVTLKSGGYLVINQTEALVAIDVNSGRATRHHSIEDTATQTNLEAADEVARQLRLRDLAGLIVIDFIDMEEKRNNRAVEKRLKEALKNDRARIQVSRISHFGLLEMSRQRIRASVLESTTRVCPTCEGVGHVRSASSIALHVLRSIEENLLKSSRHNLMIKTSDETALYILNSKRMHLVELEARFGVTISIETDPEIGTEYLAINRGELATPRAKAETHVQPDSFWPDHQELDEGAESLGDDDVDSEVAVESNSDEDRPKRKRRRSRRGRGRSSAAGDVPVDGETPDTAVSADGDTPDDASSGETEEAANGKRRRRGRRGGRNKTLDDGATAIEAGDNENVPEAIIDDTPLEVTGDAIDEKPGRNRRPRRTKKEKPVESQAASEDKLAEVEVVEASPEAANGEETAKPQRRASRRPRKKKVEIDAGNEDSAKSNGVDAEPVVAAVDEVIDKPEAEKPRRKTRRKASAKVEEATAAAVEPAAVAEAEPATPDEDSKKGGWWQRRSFF